MADFCHKWEPGGLGCHGHNYPENKSKKGKVKCPPDCLGDFTELARDFSKKLKDGQEIILGLCEVHEALVYMSRLGEQLYVEHVSGDRSSRRMKWKVAARL